MNGIIVAIEKDSRKPLIINKKNRKYNCLFLALLKNLNNLYKGLLFMSIEFGKN
tara:strand:- start:14 stop:175 length:162 start_codon:yes stop_codon:yes gene_type:complete